MHKGIKKYSSYNLLFFLKTAPDINKEQSNLYLALAIYLLGLLFIIIEVIVPHGVTGFLGIIGILSGIVLVYLTGPPSYSIYLGIFTVIALPSFFYLVYKKMQLKGGLQPSSADYSSTVADDYINLIGQKGIALTPLRPSGLVLIDNKKVDAVSERDIIEKGETVVVSKVEGIRIVVKKI